MKLDKIDLFVFGSMLFFWYALYPTFNATRLIDIVFYFGIPTSGFLCIMYLKAKERLEKKEELNGR